MAKFKETLLIMILFSCIALEGFRGGFLGMNFHYLSVIRFRLLNQLQRFSTNSKFDSTTRLDVSYQRVGGLARVKQQ